MDLGDYDGYGGKIWTKSGDTWTRQYDSSPATDYHATGVVSLVKKQQGYPVTYKEVTDLGQDVYRTNYTEVDGNVQRGLKLSKVANAYWEALQETARNSESSNTLPRASLGAVVGNLIKTQGIVLEKDNIPPIDKAAFIQYRKQLRPELGVTAWYLRSIGGRNYTMQIANGTGNDSHSFSNLANVLGLGAQWQMGKQTALSFDYGQNRTAFGKYMNGETVFEHRARTDVFTPRGRSDGSAPIFWTMRLTIGNADTDRRGSWNAFADYKYFEHGAFFGGNGTGYLPDRYMDGIKSFTIGGGYVPARNWLVELFYTFDAKGTNQRDTLHGPEKFKLGNYTRFQLTYRF